MNETSVVGVGAEIAVPEDSYLQKLEKPMAEVVDATCYELGVLASDLINLYAQYKDTPLKDVPYKVIQEMYHRN